MSIHFNTNPVGVEQDKKSLTLSSGGKERLQLLLNKAMESGQSSSGNLYEGELGPQKMLDAFELLITKTPLISFGHKVANGAVLDHVEKLGVSSFTLLDLGIGFGAQWKSFFAECKARSLPLSVRLIGVDVPAEVDAPLRLLEKTGGALQNAAQENGINLEFIPIARRAEELRVDLLSPLIKGPLFTNAAFVLHHLHDETVDPTCPRDELLALVHALCPELFTLTEPHSTHTSPKVEERLSEVSRSFGLAFEVIDALIPESQEREIIEQVFFGSEILNILSKEGKEQFERHERFELWKERILRQGFTPHTQLTTPSSFTLPSFCTVGPYKESVALIVHNEPVVVSSAWMS